MNVLVTGGAGFIGSHIAKYAIEKLNWNVIILDDLSGGFIENIPKGAEFVEGSICDYKLVDTLFKKHKFDYIFHFAAYAAEGLSHFIRRFNYENNVIGSINIINASIKYKIKCLLFTSSIAVYGAGENPLSESMIVQPEDPYGIAKYTIEKDLEAANNMFGLNYIIYRPHNVYGENQNIGDKYRNVIGIFMNQIMQNKPLTIFGDGLQKRAFSYIGDISNVITESVLNKKMYNQIFNIGSDTPYTVLELAKTLSELWNKKDYPIKFLQARKEVYEAYTSHELIKSIISYDDSELKIGLEKMTKYAQKVGAKKSKPFSNIELTENLPEGW